MEKLIGKKFGELTVLGEERIPGNRHVMCLCLCDCGNKTTTRRSRLKSGDTKTCGHNGRSGLQHGRHGEPIYKKWKSMRARCNNKSSSSYYKYGARGIKVCERWDLFENFLEDMGEMPDNNHSIERIDVNGNYEPSNCKWIPLEDQRWNTTRSRKVTYKGVTKNVNQWAVELNVNRKRISNRLDKGMTMEEIYKELAG